MTNTPLLDATIEAETANASLLVGVESKRLIGELTRIASDHSCELISGASPAGNQLAGALIYASRGRLRPWTPNESGDVLAVDGIVAGLSGLRSHMTLLGRMTTSRVYGVALASSRLLEAWSADVYVVPTESLITSVA